MGAAAITFDAPWASGLLDAWDALPAWFKMAGHCAFVAGLAPEFRGDWLVHYILTFFWGFGGGTLSSLLLMDPKRAPIALFAYNEVGLLWTLCWWLVNYCPIDAVRAAFDLTPVKAVTKACTALLRAVLIVARVDLAVALYPGVIAAPLVLGTIAGCGGRLVVDALKFGWGRMPPGARAEISAPGFTSRSAFVATVVYYVTAHALRVAAPRAAAGAVVTALVLHALATEPLAMPLDWTEPLADAAHAISFVPKPGSDFGAGGAKASARAGTRRTAAAATATATAGAAVDGSRAAASPVRRRSARSATARS